MALSKYNKDRPFLIIEHRSIPSDGVRTEEKGWGDEETWQVNELVSIVDRVTNKHLTEATLVIDILKRNLIKNRFVEGDPNEILKHYLSTYKGHITEGVSIWMKRKTTTTEEAEIFIHDLEDEIGEMEALHEIPVDVIHTEDEIVEMAAESEEPVNIVHTEDDEPTIFDTKESETDEE